MSRRPTDAPVRGRNDRGYNLTLRQRRFLLTIGGDNATAWVNDIWDDGAVHIIVAKGCIEDGYIVYRNGTWESD